MSKSWGGYKSGIIKRIRKLRLGPEVLEKVRLAVDGIGPTYTKVPRKVTQKIGEMIHLGPVVVSRGRKRWEVMTAQGYRSRTAAGSANFAKLNNKKTGGQDGAS